jgi:integrase
MIEFLRDDFTRNQMHKRASGEGTIFQNKQGYWVVEVTLPNGKRKRKYAKVQKDAKTWLLGQRSSIRDAVWTDKDSVTVSAFLDRYMEDVGAHTLRPKTIEAYSYLIRLHIKPEIGNVRLTTLSPAHVQHLYTTKLNSGLSRRTVQFIHAVLHKTIKQAMRWGLVVRNVCDLVNPPSVTRKAPTTWNLDEVRRFIDSAKDSRFYGMYVLGIAVGMRIGELLGLQVQDVDFTAGSIQVRHAILALKGQGLVLTEPKTQNARRSIKVPKFALEVLAKEVEGKSGTDYVFATSRATPFSPRNVVRDFKTALNKAELPEIRFHDLRHTCATLHLLAGTHPKAVQEILGHSQISLTMNTYSHVLPSVQYEAAERMDGLLRV